jgi:WD40 repeat protein
VSASSDTLIWDLAAWPVARPLRLRRNSSWTYRTAQFDRQGEWLVVSPDGAQLVFWPVPSARPVVVDRCTGLVTGVRFSADGQWLASNCRAGVGGPGHGGAGMQLWPLPGASATSTPSPDLPAGVVTFPPVIDPQLRFVFVRVETTSGLNNLIVPLDGTPRRKLVKLPEGTDAMPAATSPDGRLAATAWVYGDGPRVLRVWNLETGDARDLPLPSPSASSATGASPAPALRGDEGVVNDLAFADETTLLSAGDSGIFRWDLVAGTPQRILAVDRGRMLGMAVSADGRTALTFEHALGPSGNRNTCGQVALADLREGTSRRLVGFGACGISLALDPSGAVAATADHEGIVRVGRVDGGEPHLLFGHDGAVKSLAISPDRRWVATVGEDNTLRLWPTPDLANPPLHTLPLDQLLAKLHSLTNLRAVRDPASSTGWKVEVGHFPGWKEVPGW